MNYFKALFTFGCILFIMSTQNMQSQELKKIDKFFTTEFYNNDEQISRKAFITQLKTNENANKYWKTSRIYNTISLTALATELGFAVWNLTDGKEKNSTASTGVYASAGVALIFSALQQLKQKKAIETYNVENKKDKKITFQPSKKGFGLVMQF